MDEARRQLGKKSGDGGPMRLGVVSSNRPAMALYRRCNFVTEREIEVVVRRC
jgi:ribosomal protein S18 acetylase RimI-like enzyme